MLAGSAHFDYLAVHPYTFASLAAGVLLGEMLPVKIPRGGNDEEITLSTSFSIALLLAGGLGPALIAQGTASAIQDYHAGKPGWRIRFNVAQYALSMSGAILVMRAVGATAQIGSSHPFTSADLPALLFGAATFFMLNTLIVGVAVAYYQEVAVERYFRSNGQFILVTLGVMLCLAPIVVAATAYSVVLVPLFLVPMVVIHNAVWRGARSEYAARHDSLTGLPNRTAFHEAVEAAIEGDLTASCVLLVDLDRFKEVNDTLGHRFGDLLLGQVAERFLEQLGPSDHIARLGGDEFAIFRHGTDRDSSVLLAHTIAKSLGAPFELEHVVVDTQGSVGVALYPVDGTDVETLLQKADVAMYRAKETHSIVALYEERHDHNNPARLALTAALRNAVDSDAIVVWYQPELDLRTQEVFAVEALVRWQHPEFGLLTPASFLDISERTNVIKPLTQRVLDEALSQVARWRASGIDVAVAVNVSTRVLVDANFTAIVMDSLTRAGVPPDRLKLEITESTLIADPELARRVLCDLDCHGVDIAIDDFGTGYSSLAYLAALPVCEIKIDRSFVSRMASGSSQSIIVASTIDLAHHLGLRAVAEGVEDLAVLPELRSLGCDAVQGYGISRPMPADDATTWLGSRIGPLAPVRALRPVA